MSEYNIDFKGLTSEILPFMDTVMGADFDIEEKRNFIISQMKKAIQADREGRWIPVSERLPELEEDVLLFDDWKTREGEPIKDIRVGYLSEFTTRKTSSGTEYFAQWEGTEYVFNITHWQPLPPTPTHGERE